MALDLYRLPAEDKTIRVAARPSRRGRGMAMRNMDEAEDAPVRFRRWEVRWVETVLSTYDLHLPPCGALLGDPPTGSRTGRLGHAEMREAVHSCPTCKALGRDGLPSFSAAVRTLDQNARWLLGGSRLTRECHVRFCERLGVELYGATLPSGTCKLRLSQSG